MRAIWLAAWSGNVENNLLLLDVYCSNSIDRLKKSFCFVALGNKAERSVLHCTLSVCLSKHLIFTKEIKHHVNYCWQEDKMHNGHLLNFSLGFHLNGNLCLNDVRRCIKMEYQIEQIPLLWTGKKKNPLILCERLMSEPITGDRAFCDLQ